MEFLKFYLQHLTFKSSSNYMNSPWCMEEFLVAHREVVTGQKDFLIPVLMEDLDPVELTKHPELELYTKTHTYIDARKLQNDNLADPVKEIYHLRKRIRSVICIISQKFRVGPNFILMCLQTENVYVIKFAQVMQNIAL